MPTFNIKNKKLAEEIEKSNSKIAKQNQEAKTYKHNDVPRVSKDLSPRNPVPKSSQHVKTFDL